MWDLLVSILGRYDGTGPGVVSEQQVDEDGVEWGPLSSAGGRVVETGVFR